MKGRTLVEADCNMAQTFEFPTVNRTALAAFPAGHPNGAGLAGTRTRFPDRRSLGHDPVMPAQVA